MYCLSCLHLHKIIEIFKEIISSFCWVRRVAAVFLSSNLGNHIDLKSTFQGYQLCAKVVPTVNHTELIDVVRRTQWKENLNSSILMLVGFVL